MHTTWGLILLFVSSPPITVPLVRLNALGAAEPWALLVVGILAYLAVMKPFPRWWAPAALVPQQILLTISSGEAIYAILRQSYADLVPRPWSFIGIDQSPLLVLAAVHLLEVVYRGRSS